MYGNLSLMDNTRLVTAKSERRFEIKMKDKLEQIRESALRAIESSDGLAKLNDVRVAFLGKKGELTAVLKGMKNVSPEERPLVGQMVNETREAIEKKLEETDRKSTRLNSSHSGESRMPSSA